MTFSNIITKEVVISAIKVEGFEFSRNTYFAFPGEPKFHEAAERWGFFDKEPSLSVVIAASNEQGVAKAISFRYHGLPSFSSNYKPCASGLVIDLSRLSHICVVGPTVAVGPGAVISDIKKEVYKAGYQIPYWRSGRGTYNSPTHWGDRGDGMNCSSGVYGLIVDSLVSAHMILHDGQIVEASETHNPDLFWAIRGAGANFGIVVSTIYKLQEPINHGELFRADVILPTDQTKDLCYILNRMVINQPAELVIIL
ncbi:FAD-linked oxidoreductase srdI [Paramyrothecium foliicola]|nr:FAD-linked oxidoreductase srdI [Paramyrothecium foliicola]